MNRYIDESEFEGDKTLIKGILQKIYSRSLRGRLVYLLTINENKTMVLMLFLIGMVKKFSFMFEEEDDAERYAMMLKMMKR